MAELIARNFCAWQSFNTGCNRASKTRAIAQSCPIFPPTVRFKRYRRTLSEYQLSLASLYAEKRKKLAPNGNQLFCVFLRFGRNSLESPFASQCKPLVECFAVGVQERESVWGEGSRADCVAEVTGVEVLLSEGYVVNIEDVVACSEGP